MKKALKYISWIPFAISIGSLTIYLFYTLKIRFSKRVIVTVELTNTLKAYLIIALISLFIGLFIMLLKKVYNLLKSEPNNTKIRKEDTNYINLVRNEEIKQNVEKNPEVHIHENKEYNFKLEGVSCPECGKIISKDALICPYCGIMFDEKVLRVLDKFITKKQPKKKVKKGVVLANILLIIVFMFLIFLVSNMLINKSNQNKQNINAVVINEENIK